MSLVTLVGTYGKANETAPTGYLEIQPMVTHARDSVLITQAPVTATLVGGKLSVDLIASDDPGWVAGPVPYIFREYIEGQVAQWMAFVNSGGPLDISELVPLEYPPVFPPAPPAGGLGSFDYVKVAAILDVSHEWMEIAALTIDRPAGTYMFGVSFTFNYNVTNLSAEFRFSTDGGQTWGQVYSFEQSDRSDRMPFTYQYPLEHSGGERSVMMQARKEGEDAQQGTFDILYADLFYQRVA